MSRDSRNRRSDPVRGRAFGSRRGRAYVWLVVVFLLLVVSAIAAFQAVRLRDEKRSTQVALEVESDPAPAEVRLDGRFVGLTPVRIRGVAAGEHLVAVSLDGYEPHAERRELTRGRASIKVRLKPKESGELRVRTAPEGAEVILDGQSRGNTPLELDGLAPGFYRLVVRKAGHEILSREIRIEAGKTVEIKSKLENSVLKFLRAAVANNPKSLHYWTELGYYCGCHGLEDESVKAFGQGMILCMAEDAKGDEVRRHFQMLGRQMHWPGKNRTEFRRRIGEMFKDIARKHGQNPKAVARLGRVLEQARRTRDALELYLKGVRKTGGADATLVLRGFSVATRLKDMKAAKELLDLFGKGRPRDYYTRTRLAALCMQTYARYTGAVRKELLAMAERLYGEAATQTSSKVYQGTAYYGVARAQYFAGKVSQAADSYGKAADAVIVGGKRYRGKWADWQFERAGILEKLGRTQDARAVLTKIASEGAGTAVERAKKELQRLKAAATKK
jgi:tetratricopeptide (TPR) repeat protein